MIMFDDALPEFVAIIAEAIGQDAILDHIFLRDAAGRLTFIILSELSEAVADQILQSSERLRPWIADAQPLATPEDVFDGSLREPNTGILEFIEHNNFRGFVRLVERRIVGQDWLHPPADLIPGAPPIVAFASHKGGVGRTTALAVAASAFSQAGNNILVVDLDLEAPGLDTILLRRKPQFGTLDYFVESGISVITDVFLDELVGVSELSGNGVVHVIPALGIRSDNYPQNVLGKIARAYVEQVNEDGSEVTFLDRARSLVETQCSRFRYDAIFIDARAGLNEATAAAVLGLGADVLLFGVDTPQTFSGYRYFLSHLARFKPSASGEEDWRYRIRMVHAKASSDPQAHADFRTRAFDLFAESIYDVEEGIEETAFNFDYEDSTAPHYAWPILNDSNYSEFNPIANDALFAEHMYGRTFGSFLGSLGSRLELPK